MKSIKAYVTIYDTNYKAIFTNKMKNKIKLRWIHMMPLKPLGQFVPRFGGMVLG
jgi:hypothetical protein